jgi:hypothetical protein
LSETTTDSLEQIPRRFFVLQTVREKFTCRDCEAISQSPAPFHATPRGWAGPNFLAGIVVEKFGKPPDERLAARSERSAPLVAELHAWMLRQREGLSRHHHLTKAIAYMLNQWEAFTRFLTDGRICLSNNAAERALRGIALGRKSWLFCGSDRGGQRAAAMYSLIVTAKLNDVDPHAWLADVLRRIAGHPAQRVHELLPWAWKAQLNVKAAA